MKKLLLFGSMMFMVGVAAAGVRQSSNCEQIAKQRLGVSQVQRLETNTEYDVYGAKSVGFVIVSNDAQSPRVIAYSTSDYDRTTMPQAMNWWLEQVTANAATPHATQSYKGKVVTPLLTTTWGQEAPFNDDCPEVGGVKAPTGCLATAMAQILKYYQYPTQGTGTATYTVGTSTSPRTVTISTNYDWANMLDSYEETEDKWFFTKAEKKAVSSLMFDCGASSRMNYRADASGATPFNAALGLTRNFGMDSLALKCDIGIMAGSDYDGWMAKVYAELAAKRPVLYCGADPDYGGHAFVIDGVDADGLVHINWGWNGAADGYFDLRNLNPAGILGSEDTYHFDYSHYMVRGMRCTPEPEAGAVYHSQWAMSANDIIDLSEDKKELSINFGDLYNASFLPFTGYVGLILEVPDDPSQDNLLPVAYTYYFKNTQALEGLILGEGELIHNATYSSEEFIESYGLSYGVDYHMYIGSWHEGLEERGVPAIYPGGVSNYTLRINTDGTMTLTENVEEPDPAIKGDVNGDGQVNSNDIAIVVNIIAGLDDAEDYDGRADVSGDDVVNANDIAAVVDIISGVETE